jgi:hypothetical protein
MGRQHESDRTRNRTRRWDIGDRGGRSRIDKDRRYLDALGLKPKLPRLRLPFSMAFWMNLI